MALNRAKLLESADRLVRQGKIDEAIRHYQTLSEDNPRDLNTINRIGDLYVRLRKNKEAIRQFMRIADLYASDGFHLKAIAMYKKITKLEPAHPEANERLADLYGRQGLAIEARTQYLSLAEQSLKQGNKERAVALYEKVRDLEPDNIKIQLFLAELRAKDKDPAKAVEDYLGVVRSLRQRNLGDEALKVLQKAARLQPAHPDVLALMAEMLQSGARGPEDLVATLESLYRGEPGNLRYLALLAESYLNQGKAAQFEKLTRSAESGPARIALAETEARFHLGRGERETASLKWRAAAEEAMRQSDPDRALAFLEQAHQAQPDRAEALEKIVEICGGASRRDGMVSATERLARLSCEKKDFAAAGRWIDRLQNLSPDSPVLAELQSLLPGRSAPPAAPEGEIPSLDELEKVVDLDAGDSPGWGAEPEPAEDEQEAAGDEEPVPEIEPAEEVRRYPSPGEIDGEEAGMAAPYGIGGEPPLEGVDAEEISTESDETAYGGPSKIQAMRGEAPIPPMDEDFLSEHFTEAEVFLKYGLVEKAREQLQTILTRYPQHLPSWGKMREIHVEEGKKREAAEVSLRMAALHRARNEEEKAKELEASARELDPGATNLEDLAEPAIAAPAVEPAGATASIGTIDPDLDLDLGDLTVEAEEGIAPVAPVPADGPPAVQGSAPFPAAPGGEDEEEFTIELVEDDASEAPPGPGAPGSGLPDRISQVRFSLEQGLREEAEAMLASLERSAPNDPEVRGLRAQLQSPPPPPPAALPADPVVLDVDVERAFGSASAPAPAASSAAPAEDGFFDLAAELKQSAVDSVRDAALHDPVAGISAREGASIDEIFKAFRKKVDQQVEEEDYETRYNLGIAYKEMGLLDEAIGEFQYASREPKLFLECCSILGICFREKGMTDLAVKWYRKALEITGYPEEKYQGLRYDLAELYRERGEFTPALALFSEVYGVNSNYRDVASRIRELRKRIG